PEEGPDDVRRCCVHGPASRSSSERRQNGFSSPRLDFRADCRHPAGAREAVPQGIVNPVAPRGTPTYGGPMDEEEIRGWIEQLLDELAAIRIELDALESPAADPTWLVVIAALAVALAAAALVVAMLALRSRDRAASPSEVDEQRDARAAFASELRTYSQVLGVEAVTGRPAGGGYSAEAVRARLDARAAELDAPGALELLDEVRKSRRRLADLPPETRAASSGLAGMTVEWS